MDGTKQLASNSMIHAVNVYLSVVIGKTKDHDQCGIYFTALVIDVTVGLAVTYYLLVITNFILSRAYTSRLKSGNYFKGVKKGNRIFYVIDYKAWIKQILVWLGLVIVAKMIIVSIQIGLNEVIGDLGDQLMKM